MNSHKFVIIKGRIDVWDEDYGFSAALRGDVTDHGGHFEVWTVTFIWGEVATLDTLRLKDGATLDIVVFIQLQLELLQFLNHFFFRLLRHWSDVCIDVVIDGGLVGKVQHKLVHVIFEFLIFLSLRLILLLLWIHENWQDLKLLRFWWIDFREITSNQ